MRREDINLSINPETVELIIVNAREFHAKEGVTFPDEFSVSEYESDALQILADHQDDWTLLETKKIIEELDVDQQTDLLTLLYIGRGDYEVSEWKIAYKEAKNNLAPRLAEYLLSKPHLSEYLEQGLLSLGYSLTV